MQTSLYKHSEVLRKVTFLPLLFSLQHIRSKYGCSRVFPPKFEIIIGGISVGLKFRQLEGQVLCVLFFKALAFTFLIAHNTATLNRPFMYLNEGFA